MSLVASRWRLVRQLLVESLMLALEGGAVALLITSRTAGTLINFLPTGDFPLWLDMQTDRTVLLATVVISVLTGIIFGIFSPDNAPWRSGSAWIPTPEIPPTTARSQLPGMRNLSFRTGEGWLGDAVLNV